MKSKEITVDEVYEALILGKLVIAYFKENGDYRFNHLAAPVEIRMFHDGVCTYTAHGTHMRICKTRKKFDTWYETLGVHPVCVIDKRPVREPLSRLNSEKQSIEINYNPPLH